MTLFDISRFEWAKPEPQLGSGPEPPETQQTPETQETPEAFEGPGPDETAVESAPQVEVRISARRKKTSEARWEGDRIVVYLPSHLDEATRHSTVEWLVQRLITRYRFPSSLSNDDLLERAVDLSERYLIGERPSSVRWVTNQTARWGSCSYYSGDIRLSHRLCVVPGWVLDSVLVHEVAHLTYPDHSADFHRLASGYPRHQEAGVFLAGYSLGLSTPKSPSPSTR
ncbi:MAG TPA: M48 family metallopeptidase [Acidimicrobiales bacterium]|nr:M48 family metallopeptidase [Acidimicrobiales bacterium]